MASSGFWRSSCGSPPARAPEPSPSAFTCPTRSWPSPWCRRALENFLDARRTTEVASIGEVIFILETRTSAAHEALDSSLRDLQKLRTARAKRLGHDVRHVVVPAVASLPDPETEQLLVQVKSKRLAIADLEDFQRRHLAELESRLQQLRVTYSDTHPAVVSVEETLQAARRSPPRWRPCAGSSRRSRRSSSSAASTPPRRSTPAPPASWPCGRRWSRRTRWRTRTRTSTSPSPRCATPSRTTTTCWTGRPAVRLEQDRAGAAFKYRYVVLWPPQKPLGPYRPKPVQDLLRQHAGRPPPGLLRRQLRRPLQSESGGTWQLETPLGLALLGRTVPGRNCQPRPRHQTGRRHRPSYGRRKARRWPLSLSGRRRAVAQPDGAWVDDAGRGVSGRRGHRLPAGAASRRRRRRTPAARPEGGQLPGPDADPRRHRLPGAGRRQLQRAGERMRFVVATASPAKNPAALSILKVCDAAVLLLQQGRSRPAGH